MAANSKKWTVTGLELEKANGKVKPKYQMKGLRLDIYWQPENKREQFFKLFKRPLSNRF